MSHGCIKSSVALLVAALLVTALPLQGFASEADQPRIPDVAQLTHADDQETQEEIDDEEIVAEIIIEEETTGETVSLDALIAEQNSHSSDPRVRLINSADLTPVSPKSKDLDQLLESIMSQFITDDMTTYDKVKACYDYLVANTRYGGHNMNTKIGSTTAGKINSQYGKIEGYGAVVLGSKQGMCNAYNAAFILMVRKIGLDADLVVGSTRSRGGGYAHHQWTEVTIDGNVYVFDPQLEQNLRSAGLSYYMVFGTTYNQVPGRYAKY